MRNFFKKFLFLGICFVLMLNISSATDISWSNASSWAVTLLNEAKDSDLIPEILNGQDFKQHINRKEFAALSVKLYEKLTNTEVNADGINPFTDTNDSEIIKAYNLGITSGTSATTFSPDKGIELFRTDKQGTIVAISDGTEIEWNTVSLEYPYYVEESKTEQSNENVAFEEYILNKNTKKFHELDCSSAKKIKDSNREEYTGNREELIDMGYSPCGNCKP